jgi:hypothetical protein
LGGVLSLALERFVLHHLHSIAHLDALVVLQREPRRWWTTDAIATAIGTSKLEAERILEDLCSSNLLAVSVASALIYQFNPGSVELECLVRELLEVHRGARAPVHSLIASRARRSTGRRRGTRLRLSSREPTG